MNVRICRNFTAPAAAAVSTLIVLAWLAAPSLSDSAESAQDATASPAGNADSSPPPPRRLHSSLSMPYFSFAQPLTPRS